MNIKKLLALVLALTLVLCATPMVFAGLEDSAESEDGDISADINDLPALNDVIYGDVNGDKTVDIGDANLVLQFYTGWDIEIDTTAADVNDDKTIDIGDANLILQFYTGWDVTLGPAS